MSEGTAMAALGGKRIAIIEDDGALALQLRETLEEAGADVVYEARDLPGAMAAAALDELDVKPLAKRAADLFGLSQAEEAMLNEVPYRGTGTPMPPTDPLIYRFYEMVMVNGPAWKALIEEEFGDGIMSAIDFDFDFERVANPKGDRVKITMSGKFLPYKYYGNEQGIPDYGFKES